MHGNHINRSLREWHVGLLSNRSSSPVPAFIFPPPVNKDLSVCCMSHSRVSHSAGDFLYEWDARTHSLSHSFYVRVHTIRSVSLWMSRGGEVCRRSSCRFSAPWPESTAMRSKNAQNEHQMSPLPGRNAALFAFWLINQSWERNSSPPCLETVAAPSFWVHVPPEDLSSVQSFGFCEVAFLPSLLVSPIKVDAQSVYFIFRLWACPLKTIKTLWLLIFNSSNYIPRTWHPESPETCGDLNQSLVDKLYFEKLQSVEK